MRGLAIILMAALPAVISAAALTATLKPSAVNLGNAAAWEASGFFPDFRLAKFRIFTLVFGKKSAQKLPCREARPPSPSNKNPCKSI